MERLHDACGIVGIYARENGEGSVCRAERSGADIAMREGGDSIDVRRYLTLGTHCPAASWPGERRYGGVRS